MNYLLDTCLLSEISKAKPNTAVLNWVSKTPLSKLFLSVVTLGEVQQGVSQLKSSKKKQALQLWLDNDLLERFQGQILGIDGPIMIEWGKLRGQSIQKGKTLPVLDSLLAATARYHQLSLVTRNEKDFKGLVEHIFNPWNA